MGRIMSEQSDPNSGIAETPDADVGQLPHFAFRAGGVRPPLKPALVGKSTERSAVTALSPDRSPGAGFVPQPARRVMDIPSPASVKAAEAEVEGRRLLVGRQVRIAGEISGCAHLTVEGAVDAKLDGVRDIEMATTGVLKGTADVDTAVVAGVVEGTMTVRTHLDITASGVVRGQISYRALTIATGGRITGTISDLEG
jgi:cytoskeletal protein CcmA (bactofilin family)